MISMITVEMFGHFSMSKGKAVLTLQGAHSVQVMKLLQYLLAHRFTFVTQDALIEALWPEKSCSDPMNALKALVHRLRCLLDQNGAVSGKACILYLRGRYQWNNDLPVQIDVEEFEKAWNEARESKMTDQSLQRYKEALALYKGSFLQDMAGADWVLQLSTYYQHIYTECVLKAAEIYEKAKNNHDIITLCEQAIMKNPYEEAIHECLLKALIRLNQKAKALGHFNKISQKFSEELGVCLSPNLHNLYEDIIKMKRGSQRDIDEIAKEIEETSLHKGALYCEYEVFKYLYRLNIRAAERQQVHILLGLVSLNSRFHRQLEEKSTNQSMACVRTMLVQNLRKGDVVSRLSDRQFIIMITEGRVNLQENIQTDLKETCAYGEFVMQRLVL